MITSWSWKIKLPKPLHIDGFDSALEFSWNHLLETLGLSPVHHPGSFFLPTSNTYYEPDYLLESPNPTLEDDMYLEVKGPAMERIHKPYELAEEYKFPVMLLLSPQFPSAENFPESNSLEEPWAEWRPIGTDRVVLRESVGFVRATEPIEGDYVPGSLYEVLKSTNNSLANTVRPIAFPHYSTIK